MEEDFWQDFRRSLSKPVFDEGQILSKTLKGFFPST